MYRVEQRARMLQVHMGITFAEIAGSLGISKKQFNKIIKDPELVDEEMAFELAKYFKLPQEELFETVTVTMDYGYLSDLANAILNSLADYEKEQDLEVLKERLVLIQDSIKSMLIEKQVELKIK